ncbi:hypothetical protein FA13DRAFT_1717082 [Coprinellus micaceus]|uniref:Uncharacterized protein n=1 Tax=Coprinellus micaceus TaxID=71717 RepID=A0A4Y7SHW0_COPMI|nr:hypothetical protein FA13DRAFT_1717082 [Coprinellus micaceus]
MYTEKANKERSKQRQEEEGKGVCGRSIKERRDEIRVESERRVDAEGRPLLKRRAKERHGDPAQSNATTANAAAIPTTMPLARTPLAPFPSRMLLPPHSPSPPRPQSAPQPSYSATA